MLQRQSTITKSLRAAHPKINIPESIFGDSKYAPSIYGETSTIFTAAEFEFDDTIIKSKAYRRALAEVRLKSSSSKPSIQADMKTENSNADSSSPRLEADAERREEGQYPSLERSLSEEIIDFDLIDLNFDSDIAQAVDIAPSLENSWGLSEVMSYTTLLDKPPKFALTGKPSSGITPLSPQLRPNERISKNFNGPRPTSWPPRRPSRPVGTPHVSSFSQSKPTPDAWPGLPLKSTPIIIKFNKHTHVNQAKNVFLHNPNDSPILFKIKTTTPKRYCVRPNVGHIEPGEFLTVNIQLEGLPKASLGLKGSQHPDYRDKFLVQSYTIPPGKVIPEWGMCFVSHKCAEVKMKVQLWKEEPVEEGVVPFQRARAGSF
jgi:hypothetical protein